eukprot:CAMPEP_0197003306 /NCGR_PEP_ID=MMETSP1380-20130617/7614_1 /TAXON_ID=5936 /ORGANISM="Euplotes crassus, Strain CT5" /LENGTH=62 /DNA_ID=CAMNT_0042421773 /DNA_START=8 /DNA_END=196 /DNA_ORIENTATION=-
MDQADDSLKLDLKEADLDKLKEAKAAEVEEIEKEKILGDIMEKSADKDKEKDKDMSGFGDYV